MSESVIKAPRPRVKSKTRLISNIAVITVLSVFAFCQIFPFWLQLVQAVRPQSYLPDGRMHLLPESLNLKNFADALKLADLGTGYVNSAIAAGAYTALSLIIVLVCGYVLGKKSFPGKNIIFICLMATMMIPGEVLMVPNYMLVIRLGMFNKLGALIFPGLVNIFGIFLVKQFMNTIPDVMLEAAEIDGASELRRLARIVLPLSMPIIGTYFILTFIAIWNDYLWPMIVLRTYEKFTLQLKIMTFSPMFADSRDQVLRAAGLMITLAPVIAVYLIFQRQFIESVSVTGIK
ncbi:MAG: carbohydrate ABC transporter permease [Clostridiales bacterium]|jgi:ABC-type glycerol-3-phosphate transport system permease component|nr:carbohydrate ABC transporter permease [Clostridiales bacterium]